MPGTRIARGLAETVGFEPSAVTIGKFDGVHAGHRHLLRQVVSAAREKGVVPSVLTFDRHPACVVAPDRAPVPLMSVEERCAEIAEVGIGQILVLPFTPQVAQMTPEEFAVACLQDAMRARVVLVGGNFRFGHKQSGNPQVLEDLGRKYGFEVRLVDSCRLRGRIVSTSEVREAIMRGNVTLAARLLGRPYSIFGEVVRGHGIGSKQTVPTLNLAPPKEALPPDGVYITRTLETATSRRWNSITNIGVRPTFEGNARTIETFLLEPLEGSSPVSIQVELLRRVREERKFENPEALKQQIFKDVARAQAYFRRIQNVGLLPNGL
jgi:riboflavin kinase/FMN adenylyltransferase